MSSKMDTAFAEKLRERAGQMKTEGGLIFLAVMVSLNDQELAKRAHEAHRQVAGCLEEFASLLEKAAQSEEGRIENAPTNKTLN